MNLNFQNVFNFNHWDKMLEAIHDLASDIIPFVHTYYSSPTHLHWGDRLKLLAKGVQQGDPLRPLLFCPTLHQYCQCLSSELCISCLDDITIGGPCTNILHVFPDVKEVEDTGFTLNVSRWEIITQDHTTLDTLLTSLPGAWTVKLAKTTLLGSPHDYYRCASRAISEKVSL